MSEQFKGKINVDIRDSVPDWSPFEPPKAPAGAASVIYVVLDDVGFSAMGCYGGPIETPTLSHQNKEYLARQLRAFKDGTRRNDIYTRMRSVSERLTQREIDKLAEFYATTLSY